jgi:hypothetical protein
MSIGPGRGGAPVRGWVALIVGFVLGVHTDASQADFAVQVGAFANRGNAERVMGRLGEAGFLNTRLWGAGRPVPTLTTVLVGPFSQRKQAREAQLELVGLGYSGFVRSYSVALLGQPYTARTEPEAVTTPSTVKTAPSQVVSEPKTNRAEAIRPEWSGHVDLEYRTFFHSPVDPRQHGDNVSLAAQPELYYTWNNGRDSFTFVPFLRLDQHDDERTHFDIRELTWLTARNDWELGIGVRKVFWGVTEFLHLVDIINQTDLVENIDAEDKLGQPMVNLALIRDWGTLDLFVLPYFRERTFPGPEGRPRMIPRVDPDGATYESSREQEHIDFAVRWSHSPGDWDLGLSHFAGTSREPRFTTGTREDGEVVMFPIYDLIDQTGLDVQATKGSWLWKLEAIRRSGQGPTFVASTAGFEYTFFGVFETATDLGLIMEYLYDDRPRDVQAPFEDDVFTGIRLTLNDVQNTEALLGCVVDMDSSARLCNVEASRRVSDHWMVELEVRTFQELTEDDPLYSLRRDDYAQLALSYHF